MRLTVGVVGGYRGFVFGVGLGDLSIGPVVDVTGDVAFGINRPLDLTVGVVGGVRGFVLGVSLGDLSIRPVVEETGNVALRVG